MMALFFMTELDTSARLVIVVVAVVVDVVVNVVVEEDEGVEENVLL